MRALVIACALCAAGAPGLARAVEPAYPDSARNRVALEYEYTPQRVPPEIDPLRPARLTMAWTLAAQLHLARTLYLDMALPFAYAHQTTATGSGSGAVVGSICGGLHHGSGWRGPVAWHVGGLVAVPTMLADPPAGASVRVAELARFARADLDAHRFSVKDGAVRASAGLEWRIVHGVYFRASLGPVFGLPYGRIRIEQVNELEARGRHGLGAGLRLQEVFDPWDLDPNAGHPDAAQVAFEPFLQYLAPHRGLLARAGLLLALDPPLGPAVDRGKVATLRVALGATW